MESENYRRVLDANPGIGVYVIREADHGLLYFNEKARAASQGARLEVPCHQVWTGTCSRCPLLTIGERRESRTLSTSAAYGGPVELTAVRILWEGTVPAFAVYVVPQTGGQDAPEDPARSRAQWEMQIAAILQSRFQMINTVYLDSGRCERVDLTGETLSGRSASGDYVHYIRKAMDCYVHPEDREQFWAVLSLEHLRERAAAAEEYGEEICRYRLRGETPRWIELHVIYSRQRDRTAVHILGQDITREKRREDSRLQTLEDRAYIIGSLSSLFFSTYYMDLERDTFRAVTQLHRVGDVLGEEVNSTAALQIYAYHFVHPEDQAEYLRVMNAENLKKHLRWWQPCVAVEYRRQPDGPAAGPDSWTWVRATAVLARTGPDDMPQTAVYVAQDITDSKRRSGAAAGAV